MITLHLSSTALGSLPCKLKLWRQVHLGLREKRMAARAVYGIAVHKFIDKMYKTANPALAVTEAKKAFALPKIDDAKSPHFSDEGHMITTCFNLWTGFIQTDGAFEVLQLNGVALTEQTFSFKIYEDDFLTVYFEGTLDKLGKFKGGVYAIGDWKTTSSWDPVNYFIQYELSRQLRSYRFATILESRIGTDSPLGMIGASKCGVFVDAIFLKPERNEMTVKRSSIIVYTDEQMRVFEVMLLSACKELSESVQRNDHLLPEGTLNGACEGKWGKCAYWNLCKTPPEVSKILQERDFDIVPWNPQDYNNLNEEL
jgi:hypothetical protein